MVAASYGAGVTVYDRKGNILLGRQRGRWSSFSGKSKRGETPSETARRECNEETLFAMSERVDVVDLGRALVTTTPKGGRFYMFFFLFDGDKKALQDKFFANRASERYKHIEGCDETSCIRWFSKGDLVRCSQLRDSLVQDLGVILRTVDELTS